MSNSYTSSFSDKMLLITDNQLRKLHTQDYARVIGLSTYTLKITVRLIKLSVFS